MQGDYGDEVVRDIVNPGTGSSYRLAVQGYIGFLDRPAPFLLDVDFNYGVQSYRSIGNGSPGWMESDAFCIFPATDRGSFAAMTFNAYVGGTDVYWSKLNRGKLPAVEHTGKNRRKRAG